MKENMKTIIIKEEKEPLVKSGKIYRAYNKDGSPVYLGREKKSDLMQACYENYYGENIAFKDFQKIGERSTL